MCGENWRFFVRLIVDCDVDVDDVDDDVDFEYVDEHGLGFDSQKDVSRLIGITCIHLVITREIVRVCCGTTAEPMERCKLTSKNVTIIKTVKKM